MLRLPEQIIVNILRTEMGLDKDSVWIRDQNRQIPNDNKLYIAVGEIGSKVMSSVDTVTPDDAGMQEFQQVQVQSMIQIDAFSSDVKELFRRYEIVAALRSIYSVQQQEQYYFKIFSVPTSFVNTSGVEGGSIINRFSITIVCFVWYSKTKQLAVPSGQNYFDDFTTRGDDEQTIGTDAPLFEFEITN